MKPDWPRLLRMAHADLSHWNLQFKSDDTELTGEDFDPIEYPLIARREATKVMVKSCELTSEKIKSVMSGQHRVRSEKLERELYKIAAQCAPVVACVECGLDMTRVFDSVGIDDCVPASQLH